MFLVLICYSRCLRCLVLIISVPSLTLCCSVYLTIKDLNLNSATSLSSGRVWSFSPSRLPSQALPSDAGGRRQLLGVRDSCGGSKDQEGSIQTGSRHTDLHIASDRQRVRVQREGGRVKGTDRDRKRVCQINLKVVDVANEAREMSRQR